MDDLIFQARRLIKNIQRESFLLEENFNHRIEGYGFDPNHLQSLAKILQELRALDGNESLCRDTGKFS